MSINPSKVRLFKISAWSNLFFFAVFTGVCPGVEGPKQIWQSEWEKTVDAANKEGQVNVYSAYNQASILSAGGFQKRYPQIKLVQVEVQGAAAVQRILSERRAGKYLADVHIGGGGNVGLQLYRGKAYDAIKPALILPEVVDDSKWWQGRYRFTDPEGKYEFLYIGAPSSINISYNTRLARPGELRSLRDLLNPKWKGKLVGYDIRGGGPGGGTMRLIYHHPKLGPDFIQRLYGDMDFTLTRDMRQAVDWLATDKFSICFPCSANDVERAKQLGLPVNLLTFSVIDGITGLTAEGGAVGLMNKAPHRHAAALFINWLLSREGQIATQKALAEYGSQALDSFRTDIPKDHIPPNLRRQEGVQYIDLQDPNRLDMRAIVKVFEEALIRREKR